MERQTPFRQLDELHFGKFREEMLKEVPDAGAAGTVNN